MKSKFILLFLTFAVTTSLAQVNTAISYELIKSYNKQQIDSIYFANNIPTFLLPIRYGVAVYKIIYNTVSFDSSATFASGALIVPLNPLCKVPLISYQHGTILAREDAPSRNKGEVIVGIASATDGYAVSMPDYLGLGDSPVPLHPYVHAHSEATASLDMLRASRQIIEDSLGYVWNEQLFLIGYSQGGHATSAMQRLIEQNFTSEFNITFSTPMSGPYDLSGTQANVITNDSVYSQPGFLPFVMFSYDQVYNLFLNPSDVFISPYDVILPPLFDGTHDIGDVNAVMPAEPNDILQPAVLDSFRNDPNHYFRLALQQNDLLDWAPQSPTRIYYCEADDQVSYINALVAQAQWIQNGAPSVTSQSAGLTLDHGECARIALILGKYDFQLLRNDFITASFNIVDESGVGANDGSIQANITGGVQPYSFLWSNSATTQNISNLAAGWYYVTISDNNLCERYDSIFVDLLNAVTLAPNFEQRIKIAPNPFSESTMLMFENISFNHLQIELYDLSGKIISVKQLSSTTKYVFRNESLKPGIYFMKFRFDEKQPVYKKLVIE